MTQHTSSLAATTRCGKTRQLSWFEQIFLNHIQASRLMLPRCATSGRWLPLTIRPETPESVEWVAAQGRAVLYSYALYRRQYSPDFPIPYHVAVIELTEGLRLTGSVDVEGTSRLQIGMALQAVFKLPGRLSFVTQQ